MVRFVFILTMCLTLSSVAFAQCESTEDCIEEGGMGLGKVNGATRAIYYELKETNKLLRELIEEVRKDNGTIHSEHKQGR